MLAAPIPPDDEERLRALYRYQILDTDAEQVFDDMTTLAAYILDVPIALVSLIDRERQWFKSAHGLERGETDRESSFCGHAVASKSMLLVPDTSRDHRFSDNPHVVGDPYVAFYVGIPLITHDGYALGTVCAIDRKPREVTPEQIELLEALARQTMKQLDLRAELLRRDELMRAQRALEEQKDAFIATVNHELRTPLTSIRGSLGLLQGGVAGALSPDASELVNVATRNCSRLLRLVSDMLDLEKLQNDAMQLDKQLVDPLDLVRESIEQNEGFAAEEQVSLRVRTVARLPAVLADPDRMLQVLDNLLSNAIKYSPRHSEVVISLEEADNAIRLAVYDHGPGVPDEFRENLFKKFARSGVRPNSDKPGTGLGLALAKSIVKLHGGAIGFEPNEPTGACFYIVIPHSPH